MSVSILFFCLLFACQTFSQNVLSLSDTTVNTNEDFYLDVSLSNSDSITGFQFDIVYPESAQYLDSLVKSTRLTDHIISVGEIEPGRIRVLCFSLTNSALLNSSGELLSLLYNSGNETGTFTISFDSAVVANIHFQNVLDSTQNGILIVTNVTDINILPDKQKEKQCFIYPNPFNNSAVLSYFTNTMEASTLSWFNLIGERVNTEMITPQKIGWKNSKRSWLYLIPMRCEI